MELTFKFIGWVETDTSDKIWAGFQLGNDYYACWGARGKKVNFKKHSSRYELNDLISKKKKTYSTVDQAKLLSIWPNFNEQVEQRLIFCMLANKIK